MMRREFVGLCLGASGLAVSGCGLLATRATYRFRMTVEANTPQGVRRGSSVYQVFVRKGLIRLGDVSGNSIGLDGEATVVDLPDGPLFVLLALPKSGGGLAGRATAALLPDGLDSGGSSVRAIRRLKDIAKSVRADLPRKHWPMMVRFGDPLDPKSVEVADPELIGVSRILLETTSDPVTTGLRSKLPWLTEPGKRLASDGSVSLTRESPLYARLGQGLFTTSPQ